MNPDGFTRNGVSARQASPERPVVLDFEVAARLATGGCIRHR